jgi:hypothetical protein
VEEDCELPMLLILFLVTSAEEIQIPVNDKVPLMIH